MTKVRVFRVSSASNPDAFYYVMRLHDRPEIFCCSCPDFQMRSGPAGKICKHIRGTLDYIDDTPPPSNQANILRVEEVTKND